jgi:hypothetical protein
MSGSRFSISPWLLMGRVRLSYEMISEPRLPGLEALRLRTFGSFSV